MPLQGTYEPSSLAMAREQVALYERTGGAEGGTLVGRPVVILTTVGARSGVLRKSPVMRVEHDGVYAAVGSLGGGPSHPNWYRNILADPRVELQDGPRAQDMIAREVSGDELERWWRRAVEAFPKYAEYQENTTRPIPVVLLEPVSTPH